MIIDSHVHVGGEAVGFHMTGEKVLTSMEKYGVDISLVSNADAGEFDHQLKLLPRELQVGQEIAFLKTISFARENPGKIYVLPWCKPATEKVTPGLERLISENRDVVVGLKIHPYHSNTPFDDEKVEPYMLLAKKYSLPVVVHTGNSYNDSPERVYNVAKRHPDMKFVMAHMGLGSDNTLAIKLMGMADNLYADTTWVPVETTLEVIRLYGSGRVMFGSDNPIDGVDTYYCNREGEPSLYRQYFGELKEKISQKDYENLMCTTAKMVFGI